MRFRVLGPLEVQDASGTVVEVGSPKLRALLALLLLEAGRVVPLDRVVDELWGERPPASATGTVQSYVSNLRRLLEPGHGTGRPPEVLLTRAPGYLLDVPAAEVDALALPSLVDEGGRLLAADAPDQARTVLCRALALVRGDPLADLSDGAAAVAARSRLQDLVVLAREHLATADTRLGHPDRAVAALEALVAEHPLRERLWSRLVEALWAAGRQADALEACRTCARMLADELGIDPGPELRALEQAVLRQELPAAVRPEVPVVPAPRTAGPSPAPPSDERPLVGRRGERARLRAALGEVTRGSGAVVVLEGEAGIGKTRLAEAATALAAAQGFRVAWSRCADDAGAPALWPWLQLLDQLDSGTLEVPGGSDPDQSRWSMFQDLRRRLQEAAAQAPLLVVLDDVQAADGTSLQLLGLLARHLDGIRLLVLVTVRTVGEALPTPVLECLAGLAREPRASRLQLSGLGEGDVRELVASRLADDAAGTGRAAGLARELHARTDGNPFFVVELVELLRSEEPLTPSGRSLPPSVRDVLDRRLGHLPEATLELLRLAAVAGRDVDLALLMVAGQLDAEQVITLLEPAVASGIVSEDEIAWQWRFSHALVQETLVAGLSRLAAARLHARLARALEDLGSRDVDRLAHHCFSAVPVLGAEPACRYATAAAVAARARLAHPEAAAHTRRALSLLPPTPETAAARHDLLVALGDDLLRSGHLQSAQEVVGSAIELARERGDAGRLAEAASVWGGVTLWNWRPYGVVDTALVTLLQDLADRAGDEHPALQARLLGTLGVELAYSDDGSAGLVHAERAVALARTLDDPALLGRTLNNATLAAWGSVDRVERRLASTDEAIALSGRGLPARTEFFARLHRGPVRLHLGDVAGFTADLAAATRLAQTLTGPEVRPHLHYQSVGLAMLRGAWAEAEEHAVQAYEGYRATSMWGAQCCWAVHQYTFRRREGRLADVLDLLVDAGDTGVPMLRSIAVLAAAQAGDLAEARRLQRRWPTELPRDWTTDALLVTRAWTALCLGGDLDEAYAALLPYAGRQVVVGTATACWGSYDAVLARLAAARGQDELARAHRAAAAEQGRAVGSPWQVADATLELASH